MQLVGIFGGTFDPVHFGHLAIARSFLGSGLIEELWVMLTPDPPHKQDRDPVAYSIREAMLQAAFKDEDRVTVCTLEESLPAPHYTLRTLQYLYRKHPDQTFYLCIGGDSLAHFDEWYHWQEILKLSELIIARRPGAKVGAIPGPILKRAHFIDHEPLAVSSTDIRNRCAKGLPIDDLVPKEVARLIATHSLYRN